jgi:predicted phosphodiesterase
MAGAGLLERRSRVARLPRRRLVLNAAALLAVVAATLAGGYIALVAFHQERHLTVGDIRLSVSPGHRGALDVYVPLVDWGARFESIRLPVRLRVDLQTVDRTVVTQVAQGKRLNVRAVRLDARDAIAGYLRTLIFVVFNAAAALGVLVAFAVRSRAGPKLRYTAGLAVGVALAIAVALVVLIPPRGQLSNPQYYAHGPDIPRVLSAAEAAERSAGALDQELDAQLVGLARLVIRPGERSSLAGRPELTLASDLHNNVLALPVLRNVAAGGPVFFVGDLTDRGSPLETSLVRRVASLGHPFVFVSGNHDSDYLAHQLSRAGAIVLSRHSGVKRIAGLRVAGYDDPFERRRAEGYADRYDSAPTPAMQQAFADWLRPLLQRVDVVMVHEPAVAATALAELRQFPPSHPIVFLVGHTHAASLDRQPSVTILNGGSVGAGGTGNLAERTDIGIARLIYATRPSFDPLAADLVSVDPGTGSSSARRERLDASR